MSDDRVCMHHLSKHEPEAYAEIERLRSLNLALEDAGKGGARELASSLSRVAELEAERSDKEIAYDLDQAGVKSRAADAAELVELRARVVHLEDVERGMAAALRLTNASKATAEAKAMESGADLRAERVRITDLQAQLERAKSIIDNVIDAWHENSGDTRGLHEALGMTVAEYNQYFLHGLSDRATEPRPVNPDYHERCEDELQWWRQTHTDEEPPADIWDGETPSRATALRAQLESSRAEVERLKVDYHEMRASAWLLAKHVESATGEHGELMAWHLDRPAVIGAPMRGASREAEGVSTQGYSMQKHRADLLKGYLDRALARVAELEGERNRALGVASGHMRKDASGIIGTVSELLRERNKAESRVEELQAQLDRANTSLKDWKQRAARMALKAKPLLDRATEPRADGKCT